jgi:hypothetical protein
MITRAEMVRIEADENGFELWLWVDQDPPVDNLGRMIVNVQGIAPELHHEVVKVIGPWVAEMNEARQTYIREQGAKLGPSPDDEDDDCGYDMDDPKHPTFRERMADWVDIARKAEKENA